MEMLSRTHWWMIPLLWLPVIALAFQYSSAKNGWSQTMTLFSMGVVAWTLVEYSLHRFLFHLDDKLPDHHLFIVLHFTFHGVHHYFPMDRLRLVFPPALAIIIGSALFSALSYLFTVDTTVGLFSGGLLGYVMYDMTHYYVHHGVPIGYYFRYLKSYHLEHHYRDYHMGYGITSTFWDHVFGTFTPLSKGRTVE